MAAGHSSFTALQICTGCTPKCGPTQWSCLNSMVQQPRIVMASTLALTQTGGSMLPLFTHDYCAPHMQVGALNYARLFHSQVDRQSFGSWHSAVVRPHGRDEVVDDFRRCPGSARPQLLPSRLVTNAHLSLTPTSIFRCLHAAFPARGPHCHDISEIHQPRPQQIP